MRRTGHASLWLGAWALACASASACGDTATGVAELTPAGRGSPQLWYAGGVVCGLPAAQLQAGGDADPAVRIAPPAGSAWSDVALDASGALWAADLAGDRVVRFAASTLSGLDPAPDLVLRGPALRNPGSLAFDRSGRLWVASRPDADDAAGSILRFEIPADLRGERELAPTLRLVTPAAGDLAWLGSITFDPSDRLWVTSYVGILRFADAVALDGEVSAAPDAVIATAGYSGSSVYFYAVAFDGEGALWAAAQTTGFHMTSVVKFEAAGALGGTSSPEPAVVVRGAPDLLPAGGLAFDARGDLWLATTDALLRYASPGELRGAVDPAPAAALHTAGDTSPALHGHLVIAPARP